MSDILMPKLGLTMTEGLLMEWHVAPGEAFKAGDILFSVETEKVANEVAAESDGVIAEILVAAGDTVEVGTPVARREGAANGAQTKKPALAKTAPAPKQEPAPIQRAASTTTDRIVATPLAKRIAKAKGVDLRDVHGGGPGGRIKAQDVERAALSANEGAAPQSVSATGARLMTARRVAAAKRDIPHFYVTRHAEISALQMMREDLNSSGAPVKISITHALIRALALALAEMAQLRRIWLNDQILSFDTVDIGLVTETPDGLRIPVIRAAETLSLEDTAAAANAIAKRTRDGALRADDVGGGVISISNVGMFGADSLTPIINPPHSMILGVGAEQRLFRPDERGQPTLRREIILTLACDHRVIDGADAARFLSLLAELIEKPARLMRSSATPSNGAK